MTPSCRQITSRRARHEEGSGRYRFEDRGGQPDDRDARLTEFRQGIDDRLDRFGERLERLARGR
jgi:hypothetical protein